MSAKEGSLLQRFVGGRIAPLQRAFLAGAPDARAQLARLRRSEDEWAVVLDGMPDELMGHGDAPSPSEAAAAITLRLYARHQQSVQDQPMFSHDPRYWLGSAMRTLAIRDGSGEMQPCLLQAMVARTPQTVETPLLGCVMRLRRARIPLDYERLATDIRSLFGTETQARAVALKWARQWASAGNKVAADGNGERQGD